MLYYMSGPSIQLLYYMSGPSIFSVWKGSDGDLLLKKMDK